MTRAWTPEDIRDVTIVLRGLGAGSSFTGGMAETYHDIDGLQFRDAYIAVIMKDRTSHIYPYTTLEKIIASPPMDDSAEARDAAIAEFRKQFDKPAMPLT
jgi:hypothetical protein